MGLEVFSKPMFYLSCFKLEQLWPRRIIGRFQEALIFSLNYKF